MTKDEIKALIVETLAGIAPETDAGTLPPGADLREELDLDSMDFLNFVVGLHEALGVEIPESDYAALATLEGAIGYLEAKTAAAAE